MAPLKNLAVEVKAKVGASETGDSALGLFSILSRLGAAGGEESPGICAHMRVLEPLTTL
jgi:hypothetical protein